MIIFNVLSVDMTKSPATTLYNLPYFLPRNKKTDKRAELHSWHVFVKNIESVAVHAQLLPLLRHLFSNFGRGEGGVSDKKRVT